MARTVPKDVILLSSDSECDSVKDTSDDAVFTTHRRKRFKGESESSPTGTEEIPKLTGTPPTQVFRKGTDFSENPGPKNLPSARAMPIDYFRLFFTPSLLETIVKETNRRAAEFFAPGGISGHPGGKSWKPTTVQEIRAFIAVLLEMGITRRGTIESYWEKNSRRIPWFRTMFSLYRFKFLLNFFSLSDGSSECEADDVNCDSCGGFDVLLNHVNTVFQRHYTPNQQLCIDELLVDAHCYSDFPKEKDCKRGIRIWMLCDSISKYSLTFFCHKGPKHKEQKDLVEKYGLGYTVVQKLLSAGDYLNKGYHVFTDKFYTSLDLAKDLLKQNTYLTGEITLQEIKNGFPGAVTNLEHENVLRSFMNQRHAPGPVTMISTKMDTYSPTIKKKKKKCENTKPIMIEEYNKYVGPIAECDKMTCTILNRRQRLTFWKQLIFYIFERMALNSYTLYVTDGAGTKMTWLNFISKIIHQLEVEWLYHRNPQPQTELAVEKLTLEKLPAFKVRPCQVCGIRNSARRTRTECRCCKKALHPSCAAKHNCQA